MGFKRALLLLLGLLLSVFSANVLAGTRYASPDWLENFDGGSIADGGSPVLASSPHNQPSGACGGTWMETVGNGEGILGAEARTAQCTGALRFYPTYSGSFPLPVLVTFWIKVNADNWQIVAGDRFSQATFKEKGGRGNDSLATMLTTHFTKEGYMDCGHCTMKCAEGCYQKKQVNPLGQWNLQGAYIENIGGNTYITLWSDNNEVVKGKAEKTFVDGVLRDFHFGLYGDRECNSGPFVMYNDDYKIFKVKSKEEAFAIIQDELAFNKPAGGSRTKPSSIFPSSCSSSSSGGSSSNGGSSSSSTGGSSAGSSASGSSGGSGSSSSSSSSGSSSGSGSSSSTSGGSSSSSGSSTSGSSSSGSGFIGFSDDFDDGNFDGWSAVNFGSKAAKWKVSGGVLKENQNSADSILLAPYSSTASTYAIETKAQATGAKNDVVGIVFGYQDSKNYYAFIWEDPNNYYKTSKHKIINVQNGVIHILDKKSAAGMPSGQWHNLKVEVKDSYITVLVNGVKVINAFVQPQLRKAGLYSEDNEGGIGYDDFVISQSSDGSSSGSNF